jgi:hypothetical protein
MAGKGNVDVYGLANGPFSVLASFPLCFVIVILVKAFLSDCN